MHRKQTPHQYIFAAELDALKSAFIGRDVRPASTMPYIHIWATHNLTCRHSPLPLPIDAERCGLLIYHTGRACLVRSGILIKAAMVARLNACCFPLSAGGSAGHTSSTQLFVRRTSLQQALIRRAEGAGSPSKGCRLGARHGYYVQGPTRC